MKKILLTSILLIGMTVHMSASTDIQVEVPLDYSKNLKTYTNGRFGFSLQYPADLFTERTYPDNGDGVWLKNKTNTVVLTLTGSNAMYTQNIKQRYNETINWRNKDKNTEITYKAQKKNWFVLSGYNHKDKTIFYEKRYFLQNDGKTIVGFHLEFPTKDKKRYKELVNIVAKNFKPIVKQTNNLSKVTINKPSQKDNTFLNICHYFTMAPTQLDDMELEIAYYYGYLMGMADMSYFIAPTEQLTQKAKEASLKQTFILNCESAINDTENINKYGFEQTLKMHIEEFPSERYMIQNSYELKKSQNGIDGKIILLKDKNLPNDGSGNGELDKEYKNTILKVIDSKNKTVDIKKLTYPISTLEKKTYNGSTFYFLNIDEYFGMGSYSGMRTLLFQVKNGKIMWQRYYDKKTEEDKDITLYSALRSAWEKVNHKKGLQFKQIYCKPNFDKEEETILLYVSYTYKDGKWNRYEKQESGYWDVDYDFPNTSKFGEQK